MNNYYNKELKPFAVNHRNNSTKAEIRIWTKLLRNKRMMGYSFLRQRPIKNYIADFFCKELNLIIEVDGYSHQFKYESDLKRDKDLAELGYHILRFTDDEVRNHITNVERAIVIWIEERQEQVIPLPPSKGEMLIANK